MTEAAERPSWAEEAIPVLRVQDVRIAIPWYERLGFREEWQHRAEPGFPVFASMCRGPEGTGVRVFLSEHAGDAPPNGLVYLRVADVRPTAAEFHAAIEETDGRLEVGLEDPFGNRIVVGSPSGKGRGSGYTYPDGR